MERLHHGRWIVSQAGREQSGRPRWLPVAGLAAVALLIAAAVYFAAFLPTGSGSSETSLQAQALAPDDERLVFSHYAGELSRDAAAARIVRPIDTTDQGDRSGLKYAAPGARVSFTLAQKAAGQVSFSLTFDGLMTRPDIYSAAGVVLVDGAIAANYDMPIKGSEVPVGDLVVNVKVPAGRHTVSLVLPYGASVVLGGVSVPAAAEVTAGPRPPAFRVVLIGDSRLNGAGASSIAGTIAFQLAQQLDAEVINLANGGRQLAVGDFAVAGQLAPDVTYSLFDYNDFYPNGQSLDTFGLSYAAALREFTTATSRAGKPNARLRVITSFASASDADFSPPGPFARNAPSLEAFRGQERREVAALGSANVRVIEGRGRGMPAASAPTSLDGVHFTDEGQKAQAAVLAAAAR